MGLKIKCKNVFDEEKAVINTAMAGLNEKDIFSPAEPADLAKRAKEFSGKFRIGGIVKLKNDVGFYDYETGGGQVVDKGSVGKITNFWPIEKTPTQVTVEFPNGSAGIFGFDDLEPINEDIFKPAKKRDVEKRKEKFDTEGQKALIEVDTLIQEFFTMYNEFTRDDEDPPEYLTELHKEMSDINWEIHPTSGDTRPIWNMDMGDILSARDRAKELLRQLKIYVTGEDIDKNARPGSMPNR